MTFNPYDYMLSIKNNAILHPYLETSSVSHSTTTGWNIQGISKLGLTEIYQLSTGVIRITLPIRVPSFVNAEFIHNIVDKLNTTIEGVCGTAVEDGELFIEYYIHTILHDDEGLDKGLITFLQEKKDIETGFDAIKQEINKVQDAMSMMDEVKNALNNVGKRDSSNVSVTTNDTQNMNSVWSTMEEVEKSFDPDTDNTENEKGIDDPGDTLNE